MTDPAVPARRARRARAGFAVAVVVVDAMGIGLIMPVAPDLLAEIAGLGPAEAAPWGGWMAFAYAAAAFLCGPLVGDLSDRFGRRPVLIAALAALSFDYMIAALAGSIWLLIVARALSGMAGATYGAAAAYLADITPADRRARAFGLIGAGFGAGFVLGPMLGGLLGEFGPRAPFLAAAGLCAAMSLGAALALPESLAPELRRRFDWRRADPFTALRGAARLPGMAPFLACLALLELAFGVYPSIWSFYAIEVFAWTPAAIGLSLGFVGLCLALSQGVLMGPAVARFGEMRVAFAGLAFCALSLAIYAVTPPEAWVLVAIPLIALSALANPAIAAMMSHRVEADAQGRLQGVLASLQALTAALSPPLFTAIFEAFAGPAAPIRAPGAPFVLALVLTFAAVIPLLAARRRLRA